MTTDIITLHGPNGSSASISPAHGFNCFSFQVLFSDGPHEVLWADPQFAAGTTKPTRSGIPLLFPFPGRLRGTSFRYDGRQYALAVGDDFGNAIHGFVVNRPWRVVEQTDRRATGEFHASVDDLSLLDHWPADFRIRVTYALENGALRSEFVIDNPDRRPLPFGLGTHGYFRVPLGPNARADDCRAFVPVSTNWELAGMLPTGPEVPSADADHLRAGMTFDQILLDHVFGGLQASGGTCVASILDPTANRRLTLTFADVFRVCVVFVPPHRQALCIEPYTTVPNAFELLERGVDLDLHVLAPGETFRAWTELSLEQTVGH